MADTKGSDLTQITTIADGDGIYAVDDLGGTPVSKLITFANLLASIPLQTSDTDATATAAMLVGAFGLGSVDVPVVADFTADIETGFYRCNLATAVDSPNTEAFAGSVVVIHGTTSEYQLFVTRRTDVIANQKMWYGSRAEASGSSVSWQEILINNSIVGTVSESSGVPTGEIIEAGSNANGNYTKWADGTMICTHDLVVGAPNVAIGNVFRTASTDWTYPVAFVSGSPPSNSAITTSGVAYSWGGMGASAATVTVAKFVGVNSGTSGTSMTLAVTAVGRWF